MTDSKGKNKKGIEGQHLSMWLFLLFIGSAVLTTVELVLVNRKAGIITGGFLTAPIECGMDLVLLCVTLFISNAALAAVPLQILLWGCDRLRCSRSTALTIGLAFSFLPVFMVDVLWNEVSKYFGDTVNYFFLKRMGNGSPVEIFSQAYAHLVWFGLAAALMLLIGYGAIRLGLRWIRIPGRPLSLKSRTTFTLLLVIGSVLLVFLTASRDERLKRACHKFPALYAFCGLVQFTTDWDRDGSGMLARPPDPAPRDARIYPFAPDIPGNGIDENGLMGDLPEKTIRNVRRTLDRPVFRRKPHFVLIVLESLRADLLYRKEKGKAVTPNLNRLADEGVAAEQAFCHNGFTVGAMKAIFLGNPLNGHGQGTLFKDFKSNGYYTACFSGQDESFDHTAALTGMNGVDHFYDARRDIERRSSPFTTPGSLAVPGRVVTERLGRFLQDRKDDPRPLFVYVNLQDAHFPYQHYDTKPLIVNSFLPRSEMKPKNRKALLETYLNAAANTDAYVGKIITKLQQNLKGDLAILAVSDHGESLFEEGILGHGIKMEDRQFRILFIAKGFPARIEEPIGQSDIREMIQEALSVPDDQVQPPKRLISPDEKRVFQYIGSLSRPSRIAWLDRKDRWEVDLRNLRQRRNSDPWSPLGTNPDGRIFRDLVFHWEALQKLESDTNILN